MLDVPARGPRSRGRVAAAVEAIDQVCAVSAGDRRRGRSAWPARGGRCRWCRTAPTRASSRRARPSEARARLGLPDDGPIVSYVGKLVPRKGVDTLVEAMGLLARRPAGAPLLVAAGIGEEREPLERRAAELGVADRVRFVGKVAHDEVGWWMAAGDLFVLPSLSEGLPTVVCEAMNCGRPVVATAVDGTPEIVRDGRTGLLVPPSDPRRPRRRRSAGSSTSPASRRGWARRPCASGARSTPGRPTRAG